MKCSKLASIAFLGLAASIVGLSETQAVKSMDTPCTYAEVQKRFPSKSQTAETKRLVPRNGSLLDVQEDLEAVVPACAEKWLTQLV